MRIAIFGMTFPETSKNYLQHLIKKIENGNIQFYRRWYGEGAYIQNCKCIKEELEQVKDMVKKYGDAAVFASGMVVDALKCFNNLWDACSTAKGVGEDISL